MTNEYYAITSAITSLPATAGADGAITTTVRLTGEFDLAACDDLRLAVLAAIDAKDSTNIVVELTEVDFIDSETVNVLLLGYSQALQQGLSYQLVGARGVVRRVLDVMGLFDLEIMQPDAPDDRTDQAATSTP